MEPHAQEAGIAACSPPSKYVMLSDLVIDTEMGGEVQAGRGGAGE
jgi:hypothetical protein